MTTIARVKEPSGALAGATILAWFLSYVAARAGLEIAQTPWLRILLAILPIPFFLAVIRVAYRAIASGDELFRRIHLEALAVAFPVTVTLLRVLGLFELATGLNPDDFSYRHVWPMVVVAYYGGWALSQRKYK
ncbi:MAG TPA: hypothetical protein VGC44_08125 [Longimicrobiales bacterium]